MVRRSLVVVLSVLLLVGGLVTSRAGVAAQDATPAGEPIKVAFVYVGPIGDLGWTYAHDQGRLALEEALPNVETAYQENVPENPADAERVIRQFAQDGLRRHLHDVVWLHGPDDQRRQGFPGHDVHPHLRVQDGRQRRHRLRQDRRAALRLRPDRRRR